MSQNRQVPPGFGGGPGRREEAAAGGGSVRRARELLEAGVRRELPAQSPYGNSAQSPGPIQGLQPRGKPPTRSNPVPMAQQGKLAPSNSFTPRGPPPLRPRRPDDLPSPLQNDPAVPTQARQPLPTSDERDSYVSPTAMIGKDYRSSAGSEALTDISENIPAPPVAATQATTAPPRRNTNLAPPPTSRRGPSSYYSRGTGPFVSPIAEEFSDNSPKKDSYASSAVIPLSWGSGPPESDVLGNYHDVSTSESDSDSDDDFRRSDVSNDDHEPAQVVRQASLGKRGKPALRTISNRSQPGQGKHRVAEETGLALTGNQGSAGATRRDSGDGALRYPSTVDLESRASTVSSDSSDSSGFYLEKAPIGSGSSRPRAPEQVDRNVSGTERNAGGLATPAPGMSEKVPESRRPPRLNVDAVREAEARGSLTSLTDLIKRATTLASNLERGRTASRLGFLDMLNGGRESSAQSPGKRRTSGSISDILASFPPPRNDTPNTEQTFWPYGPAEKSKVRDLQSREATTRSPTSTPSNARRRCCGMSLRAFVFLCIVAFLLVAATVILPVVLLVVLPRSHHTVSANSSNATDTNPCQKSLPCMNGGVSVMNNNNTCACVCVNGFSGRQCTISNDASCTTTEVGDGSSIDRNATVGSALPRLFSESQVSFNIPLNEAEILSLFSANDISCTTQNALVSFNGLSEKRRRGLSSDPDSDLDPSPVEDAGSEQAQTTPAPAAAVFLGARDHDTPVATSNGILFEPEATSTPSSSSASSPTVTAVMLMGGPMHTGTSSSASSQSTTSSASSSSSPSSSSSSSLTAHVLDFARIAVLFIFQQTDDLRAASTAQSNIASFLTDMPQNNSTDMNMGMNASGSGANTSTDFVLNFANFTITLANGTVVGGGRGSTG